ncbi:hypothetical protein IC614_02830 [Allosphingosinicella flava]|uniref:Uncharacterized protein n=1 Tax=Allosphingosinicella flava TaxID=2771430 RepID=A0A7T2LMR6_9SPHN|nr:hypothetical protein [Sphingosinicella flava]QPQ55553.1 hypothetical protein IC614_02830 [Sphingosinicella flava]
MKAEGYTFTEEQVNSGLAAMTGQFRASDIENALEQAGVPRSHHLDGRWGGLGVPCMRGADRLLQRERKAGRITHLGNGIWERISQ